MLHIFNFFLRWEKLLELEHVLKPNELNIYKLELSLFIKQSSFEQSFSSSFAHLHGDGFGVLWRKKGAF